MLAHYAIRELMCRAADESGHDPDRISFIAPSGSYAARSVTWRSFPPDRQPAAQAAAIAEMLEQLSPQRRLRSYPRVIKRARHNSYRVKRPGDTAITHINPRRSSSKAFRQRP